MLKTDTREKLPSQDEEFINRTYELFDEFYEGTRQFRQKCRENEEFWQANHWNGVSYKEQDEPRPVTPVIFSTLESLLADIMDSYPEPVLLGEEPGDDETARRLNEVIKFILKRRNYRATYRNKCRAALKKGASMQEVYWDKALYGGLGDVNVRHWDIESFLYDPKCADIQQGRACFKFTFVDMEWIKQRYPGAAELIQSDGYRKEEKTGENIKSENDVMVMEYWYKKRDDEGNESVHTAILAGHVLLEKSEDAMPGGVYEHSKYPFIVEPLYPLDNQPVGLGIIDVYKNLQLYADKLDQIILKNALMASKVKMLVNRGAELDEDALSDWSKEVVRGSRIDEGGLRWFQPAPLSPYVLEHFYGKIQAIKEESGQTQVNRGEAAGGITAASAIIALQEAGSKRSRMLIEQMYEGFEDLIEMMIALIAENYTEERTFRITGEQGEYQSTLSGDMLKKGGGPGHMEFDISVQVQKATPYRTLYQNELAMQLLGAGIIGPEEALSMMVFEGKDRIKRLGGGLPAK
ncbi:MAG: hypothetical protein Q8O09_04760 [Bacillota bacterium]|nr:hypothetical protein [Bacillota bacterium]